MKRILITGSRGWSDKEEIRSALLEVWNSWDSPKDAILVSGACPTGADRICEEVWSSLGLTIEKHPADWGKHGKPAGLIRNKEMVDLGADICLAFILDNSRGASHCSGLAEKAGIAVRYFRNENKPV